VSEANRVLALYRRLERWPGGRWLFSRVFARKAPYFASIGPRVIELQPNRCEVVFRKRRRVENHIGTVHVIAIANALEMAMGGLAEATIPRHLRWIPKGMDLEYTAKATTDIHAVAETDPADWRPGEVAVRVQALRDDTTVVVRGTIRLHVSERPQN
jgi:acyl-coenzyme A thioesterase PaaI-like protein